MSALVAFWNLENLFAPEGFPARDITQITFVAHSGKQLVMLANHSPSRSSSTGDEAEYLAGFRASAGDVAGNVNPDGYSDHFPVSVRIEEL